MLGKIDLIIPNDIRSEFSGYNYIIKWLNQHKDIKNKEIVFDFCNVTFLEANLSALIGTIFEILESNGNKIKIIKLHEQVEIILRKNEFLLPFGFDKIIDNFGTTLIYKKFTPKDDIGFYEYIQTQLLNKPKFPSHSEKLGKEIARNIFEIYENARTHGKCDFIHTCGQFFPNRTGKPLYFTVVDKGHNIKQNVSKYLDKDVDAADAIKWAMIKGNTTKTGDTSGGLGLAVIFQFIEFNMGKIQVISSDGFYEFNRGKVITNKLNSKFDGTIVNIKFNLDDDNYYKLINEEDNFENIF